MDCAQTEWLSDKAYLQQFQNKVATRHIPLLGSIDLTHRCNLRCVHCYLGDKEVINGKRGEELGTAQWISIIDQITDAGCLYLLITGGEPLLRKDFGDIYRHAKKNGLLVTVFTNGTLITADIIGLFSDLPPRAVEISLYGATAPTYEKITGVHGSYDKCRDNIEKLLNHQINLRLKTILMTLNRHEFYDIENMAKEYGVKFRFDPAIFPCSNGDKAPVQMRIQPGEAVKIEFSDKDRSRQWKDYFERMKGIRISDVLYKCGAGRNSFHIDPYGRLQPCLMVSHLQYNLLAGDFRSGWGEVLPQLRGKQICASSLCNNCEKISLCGFCPAFFELETGAEDICSDYLCALGQYRFQAIEAAN
jgi:radical SAM protein with 4Fe4S-binding SPASM domain